MGRVWGSGAWARIGLQLITLTTTEYHPQPAYPSVQRQGRYGLVLLSGIINSLYLRVISCDFFAISAAISHIVLRSQYYDCFVYTMFFCLISCVSVWCCRFSPHGAYYGCPSQTSHYPQQAHLRILLFTSCERRKWSLHRDVSNFPGL